MSEQELLDRKIKYAVDGIKEGIANSDVGVFSVNLSDYSVGELSIVLAELDRDGYNAVCVGQAITCNKSY